jgi:hypothetical protein
MDTVKNESDRVVKGKKMIRTKIVKRKFDFHREAHKDHEVFKVGRSRFVAATLYENNHHFYLQSF